MRGENPYRTKMERIERNLPGQGSSEQAEHEVQEPVQEGEELQEDALQKP